LEPHREEDLERNPMRKAAFFMSREKTLCELLGAYLFFLLLAGCGSAPVYRYWALSTESPDYKAPVNVRLRSLRSGGLVRGEEMIIRSGPTRVEFYRADRWIVDPDELVRQKLKEIFGAPKPGLPEVLLDAQLEAFEQLEKPEGAFAHLRLEARLQLQGPSSEHESPSLLKVFDIVKPLPQADPSALAEGLSKALEEAAASILEAAARLAGKAPAGPRTQTQPE